MYSNFQYQLQREAFDAILASRAELIVVDIDDSGFSAHQVSAIARGKTILSYLSVGQASTFRWYWNPAWVDGDGLPIAGIAPAWLGARSPWPGSYEVRYWDPQWLSILKATLDRMLERGYAGAVYDVVDAYAFWEQQREWTAKARMKTLVTELMAYGRSGNPAYIGIPNGGLDLLTDPAYRASISAQMRESVFYLGAVPRPQPDVEWATRYLDLVTGDGKQVFDIEYPGARASQVDAIRRARAKGYVPYTTTPALDTLAPVWQEVLEA